MKRWIQIGLSIMLLGLLIYLIDIDQTVAAFKNASYEFVFLIFLAITFNRFLMAYKWNILLRANNINIPNFEILKIYYISNFIGLFLPATIGGDIVRLYMVNKKVKKLPEILASIFIERSIGFLVLFIFAFIALIFFLGSLKKDPEQLTQLEIIIGILIMAAFIIIPFSFNKKIRSFFRNILLRSKSEFIGKLVKKLEQFFNAYIVYRGFKKQIAIFTLLTVAEIITVILWCYFGVLAFNQHISISYILAAVPIIQVINRLPISFDGFGTNESAYVYFLSFVGVKDYLGFSIGLFIHIATIIGVLPGAIFYALDKNKIEDMKKFKVEPERVH